jgi:hypothetical protein
VEWFLNTAAASHYALKVRAISRHEYNWQHWPELVDFLGQLYTVNARHLNVADQKIYGAGLLGD